MTGIPLFWSGGFKTSTTWRASFATEEQFKKTNSSPLSNMCKLQDKMYDDDDDTDFEIEECDTSSIIRNDNTVLSPQKEKSNRILTNHQEYGLINSPGSAISDTTAYSEDAYGSESVLEIKQGYDDDYDGTFETKNKLRSLSHENAQSMESGVQRIAGVHCTSPSPFSRTRIHNSKQIAISLDDGNPLYIKVPLYVISELQEFGLQSPTP